MVLNSIKIFLWKIFVWKLASVQWVSSFVFEWNAQPEIYLRNIFSFKILLDVLVWHADIEYTVYPIRRIRVHLCSLLSAHWLTKLNGLIGKQILRGLKQFFTSKNSFQYKICRSFWGIQKGFWQKNYSPAPLPP